MDALRVLQPHHHLHLPLLQLAHLLLKLLRLLLRLVHLRLVLESCLVEKVALRSLPKSSHLHDMILVESKISAFLIESELFGLTNGLSDAYPLLLDLLA